MGGGGGTNVEKRVEQTAGRVTKRERGKKRETGDAEGRTERERKRVRHG
jgi:hypothetical protein